jgi:hypothetical protein
MNSERVYSDAVRHDIYCRTTDDGKAMAIELKSLRRRRFTASATEAGASLPREAAMPSDAAATEANGRGSSVHVTAHSPDICLPVLLS